MVMPQVQAVVPAGHTHSWFSVLPQAYLVPKYCRRTVQEPGAKS